MLTLVWIGIILAVVVTFVVINKQPKLKNVSSREKIAASGERNLFTIQVGDIISYLGDDWVVEGRVIYSDKGCNWIEYLLTDGDRIRWLSIEDDDMVEVLWFEPISLQIDSLPVSELTWDNNIYRCVESGKATIKREGNTRNKEESVCTYYDYEGENNLVLAIEIWGNETEVMAGEKIAPRSFDIFPGDGKSIYNG